MSGMMTKAEGGAIWIVAAVMLGLNAPVVAQSPPGRYVVTSMSMGATVYDTMTKLTWMQRSTAATDLDSAKTLCAAFPTDQSMSWRVPTVKELMTLVDYSLSTPPMIDGTAFPSTPSAPFISLTVEGGAPTIWSVDFGTGRICNAGSEGNGYVRCVFP